MKASARFDVVRKEDKENKLKAFIQRHLANASREGAPHGMVCLLVARTCDSPVIKALLSFAREPDAPQLRVSALLTNVVAGDAAAASAFELSTGDSCCRLSRDSRLLDAHELLILGQTAVWIGDCMRRDPATTDSYERYSEDCVETAARALVSFGRLWRAAAAPQVNVEAASKSGASFTAASTLFLGEAQTRFIASTRH